MALQAEEIELKQADDASQAVVNSHDGPSISHSDSLYATESTPRDAPARVGSENSFSSSSSSDRDRDALKPPANEPPPAPPSLLVSILWVSMFACLGYLTRQGVITIFGPHFANIEVTNGAIFEVLASNVLGCFVMGFISQWVALKKYHHSLVHVGIGTGYCGCLTSFSSWNQQLSVMLIGHGVPSTTTSQVSWLFAIFIGFWMPIGALLAGRDVAELLNVTSPTALVNEHNVDAPEHRKSDPPERRGWSFSAPDAIAVASLLVLLLAAALGAGFDSGERQAIWFGTLFAPFGATTRYLLGKFVRKPRGWFPLGTFLANEIGSAILALASIVTLIVEPSAGSWVAHVIFAIGDGFCATLTTVSSFINECFSIHQSSVSPSERDIERSSYRPRRRPVARSYFYAVSTLVVGQIIGLIINGSYELS